jgi:hypothetical protein
MGQYPAKSKKYKGASGMDAARNAFEADAQGSAFRSIGTSRNIVGVAWM